MLARRIRKRAARLRRERGGVCGGRQALAAFGAAADADALRFGATHGLWCAGSCWALMLVPLLAPGGHLLPMVAVTTVILRERLERPRPPAWRVRGLGKAIRIVVAQTRIHVTRLAQ